MTTTLPTTYVTRGDAVSGFQFSRIICEGTTIYVKDLLPGDAKRLTHRLVHSAIPLEFCSCWTEGLDLRIVFGAKDGFSEEFVGGALFGAIWAILASGAWQPEGDRA